MGRRWFFAPLQGSVTFQARGGFPERFLNLCNVRGLVLLQPQMQAQVLTATVRRKDYRRLRDAARRSGMTLHAVEKRGLPFFLRRHRAHLALPIAAAAFLALCFALSGFVWSVETAGSERVSRREVLAVMEELGLRPGVLRSRVDTAALSAAAMHRLSPRVSWLGVNLSGTRAVVEVHDYVDPGEDETFGEPANIVADFDGLLLSLEAHSGKPAAAVGSGVRTGDLLISGVSTDRYGAAHFYEARGVATALHDDTLRLSTEKEAAYESYRAVCTVPALRVLHLTIPLGMFPLSGDYDRFTVYRQAQLDGVSLPLGIVRQTRCYHGETRTQDTLALQLDDYTRAAQTRCAATNVLSTALSLKASGTTRILTAQSRCIDFIGKSQPIARAQNAQES